MKQVLESGPASLEARLFVHLLLMARFGQCRSGNLDEQYLDPEVEASLVARASRGLMRARAACEEDGAGSPYHLLGSTGSFGISRG